MSNYEPLSEGQLDGMHELKAAVLARACTDYITYKYKTGNGKKMNPQKRRKLLSDLQKRFQSEAFAFWSGGADGNAVMKKLDENYKKLGKLSYSGSWLV